MSKSDSRVGDVTGWATLYVVDALVLWADDRSANLGVRALGQGTAALIGSVWPGSQVTFHNYGSGTAPVRVGSLRDSLRERVTGKAGLIPWLQQFDLIVDTRAGDSFSDIYGLERLSVMTLLADQVSRSGSPLVLGPQTVGPFSGVTSRAMARRSLRQADVVMTRDSLSASVAGSLGRAPDVVTTDVVFALPVPVVDKTKDVVLNVSGLLWQDSPHVPAETYRRVVTGIARRLVSEGRGVTLMPHVLDSPNADNDVAVLPQVVEMIGVDVDVAVPASLDEVRMIVASANLTIGSRMHACLNSLSVGTPAIPLAYSQKFAPLLDDLGWGHTIDLRSEVDPTPLVADLAAADLSAGVATVRANADAALLGAVAALSAVR